MHHGHELLHSTVRVTLIQPSLLSYCVTVDGDDHECTSHQHINSWKSLDGAQEQQG